MFMKILYHRLLRPVLAAVMLVSLAVGVASSAWPAAQQSARVQLLADAGITNLRTLSISVTQLGEDRLTALVNMPMQGNDFKKMCGLLTAVRDASGYDRIWLTAKKDGRTVVLSDSSYRDTGTSGVTYLAPGSEWTAPVSGSLSVDRVLSAKEDSAYTRKPVQSGEETDLLGIAVPVTDRSGTVVAALVAQFSASGLDFTHLGFVDLTAVSYLGFLVFAVSLALLVLVGRLRRRYPLPQPPEPEPDFTAGGFESVDPALPASEEAPAPSDPEDPPAPPAL